MIPGPGGGGIASSANALKSATTTVSVSAATAPSSGQVLTATGTTAATWQTPGAATPVDIITVASNAQQKTFGSSGDGASLYAVNGDTDGFYRIVGKIINPAGATTYTIKFNNAVGSETESLTMNVGAVVANPATANIQICESTGSLEIAFFANIWAGPDPQMFAWGGHSRSTAGSVAAGFFGGSYNDATNLTSIVIHASTATGIGAGSWFRLYKF
jgi:hypothetical protein